MNVLLPLREGHLSLKDVDYEHGNFAAKLKNLDKGKRSNSKRDFSR